MTSKFQCKEIILKEVNRRIALNLGDNSELSALESLKDWIENEYEKEITKDNRKVRK